MGRGRGDLASPEMPASGTAVSGAAASGAAVSATPEDQRILVYEMEIPIRWGDMDAMGHVNNTVYFRYMEQARISWFDQMRLRPDPLGEGPVIVNAACTFMRQLAYPGTVLVRHYAGEPGRSSIMTYVDMARTDDPGRVYASGSAKVVWVDFRRQKSVPLPDSIRRLMRQSRPHD